MAVMTAVLLLSGCFETGKSEGRGLVLLNGSMLKGTITHADISILNEQGGLMWQGTSDAQGRFTAEYSTSLKQQLLMVTTVTPQSEIQCDATACVAPLSAKEYAFGEFMPGSEFGSLPFRSSLYLNATNGTTDVREATRQVSGLSTLVVDTIANQLDDDLSDEAYQQLVLGSCAVVAAALGLAMDEVVNILELPLPDITQSGSLDNVDPLTATLGLVNASQGKNVAQLAQFSAAIVRFSISPDDQAARATLSNIQNLYLQETQNLLDSGMVAVNNAAVRASVSQSLAAGVDFSELEQAANALKVLGATQIKTISASSTHYGADVEQTAGQWWWLSAPDRQNPQWVQLDYNNAFLPLQVEIGLNADFQGREGKIQGSNDGDNWVELLAIDSQAIEDRLDQRNVRHLRFALADTGEYRHYRFFSAPSAPAESVWLEYLCFARSPTPEGITTPCENREVPLSTGASGFGLGAENIANPEQKSGWVSLLASGREEWVAIEYDQPLLAKTASLVVKQAYQGDTPTLQGSNDGQDWTPIHSIKAAQYPAEFTDAQGFRHVEITLEHDQPYRHYRYHALPSAFVWLQSLDFRATLP